MPDLVFVVEGITDAAILRRLVANRNISARFFAAGGRTSIATLARNVLVHEGEPVMIVADADTQDWERAGAEKLAQEQVLRQFAPRGCFGVMLFLPEIEILFFEGPRALDTIAEGYSKDGPLLEGGKAMPHRQLARLLRGMPLARWVDSLDEECWQSVRDGPQAQRFLSLVAGLAEMETGTLEQPLPDGAEDGAPEA